jgi:hypothetical protein
MKRLSLLLLVFLPALVVGQTAQPARTDVYHVHFATAVPGKAAALADFLKTTDPKDPMSAHRIVLRHQDGVEWDYVVIQHLGTKATVDAAGTPTPAAVRDLGAWHTDTFGSGPSWNEFTKAMGLGDDASKSSGSVYVVSIYRAVPGHRDELEKTLGAAPSPQTAGSVLLQHLEGGPWNYLSVARYNSWADFGANEKNSVDDTNKGSGGWFDIRSHAAFHQDTVAVRVTP